MASVALALLAGIVTAALAPGSAHGAGPWILDGYVADSLRLRAAGVYPTEPSIQQVLDSLGTGMSATEDQLPDEYFRVIPGCVAARLVAEYSGQANNNAVGWYKPGQKTKRTQVFSGPQSPPSSAGFVIGASDSIAWYIQRSLSAILYSERRFNVDTATHARFYPTQDPQEFLMFWEDLPFQSDADYNDLVVLFRVPTGAPQLTCGPLNGATICAGQSLCMAFSVQDPEGDTAAISIVAPGVAETRRLASGRADSVCFTVPGTGEYSVRTIATDPCGPSDTCTSSFFVRVNSAPQVVANDTTISACGTPSVCLPYAVSDPDGLVGLAEALLVGEGTADTAANRVCFTPDTNGAYLFVLGVIDPCGETDYDTAVVSVTVDAPPLVELGRDTTVFFCNLGNVCIHYSASDREGAGLREELLSAEGTIDTAGNTVCLSPMYGGVHRIIVRATDPCGAVAVDTVVVTAVSNRPPTIDFGSDPVVGLCALAPVCISYAITDPDGLTGLREMLIAGPPDATIDTAANTVCFAPSASGNYTVIGRVLDPCSVADYDTVVVHVVVNHGPAISLGNDTVVTQCKAGPICVRYAVTDPDGTGGLREAIVDVPPGATIDTAANTICFAPAASGSFTIIASAADTCGATDQDTLVVTVTVNLPPQIALGADQTISLCTPAGITIPYTVTDPNGPVGLTETLVSAPDGATIDTAANTVVFAPSGDGAYAIIVSLTDLCGQIDHDTIVVTAILRVPPAVELGRDSTVAQCEPLPICVVYTVLSPSGPAGVTETLISGPAGAAIDTAANRICFTPGASGSYTIIAGAYDPCNNSDRDTIVIAVTVNRAPAIALGNDSILFQCNTVPICRNYAVSDLDGLAGLVETLVSAPPGTTMDTTINRICFTPPGTGNYTIIARVVDTCGAFDLDTFVVAVTQNVAPTIAFGNDTTIQQCTPSPICVGYTVSDPNGLAGLREQLVFGPPGTGIDTVNNRVCFTPQSGGNYTLVVRATDPCGLIDYDTVVAGVVLNRAPLAVTGGNRSARTCAAGSVCVGGITATDADGNLKRIYKTAGPGVFDEQNRTLCFVATAPGNYCFELIAEDSCGATDRDTLCVAVTFNSSPAVAIGAIPGSLDFTEPRELCFDVTAVDHDDAQPLTLTMVEGTGQFVTRAGIDSLAARHCFTADTTGCYRFIFAAADSCGTIDRDTARFCVRVEPPDTNYRVCLETVEAFSGANVTAHLIGEKLLAMGGYTFLVCYDVTALTFTSVQPDSTLALWEYFTYRLGDAAGCGICPGGVLRLTGIADMDNGSAHPPEDAYTPKGAMLGIRFLVSLDRSFIGHCAPLQFCSQTCSDNAISSRSGDTLFVAYGADDSCVTGSKNVSIRKIDFCNGAVCIVPPEDERGDINLNGLVCDIGDAVLFTNFFIYGSRVWDPVYQANQILASDVNCDGLVLTLADLITIIRVVIGDMQPPNCSVALYKPTVSPGRAFLVLEPAGDRLRVWVDSDVEIGAIFAALTINGDFKAVEWASELGGLDTLSRRDDAGVRALAVSRRPQALMARGRHLLFSLPVSGQTDVDVSEVQAATADGLILPIEAVAPASAVPRTFALEQNYPNPFNAGTLIRFHLGTPTSWELTIHNVLGQSIRHFSGDNSLGWVEIPWRGDGEDGSVVGTGVYFARLQAGEFLATRKMLLLK